MNREIRGKMHGVKQGFLQRRNVYSSLPLLSSTMNANGVVAREAVDSAGELDERWQIYAECALSTPTRQAKGLEILDRRVTQNAVSREGGGSER